MLFFLYFLFFFSLCLLVQRINPVVHRWRKGLTREWRTKHYGVAAPGQTAVTSGLLISPPVSLGAVSIGSVVIYLLFILILIPTPPAFAFSTANRNISWTSTVHTTWENAGWNIRVVPLVLTYFSFSPSLSRSFIADSLFNFALMFSHLFFALIQFFVIKMLCILNNKLLSFDLFLFLVVSPPLCASVIVSASLCLSAL